MEDQLKKLSKELNDWLDLPAQSELLAACGRISADDLALSDTASAEQYYWLQDYCRRWDRATELSQYLNARFWAWGNSGPVKLTLQPGQSLSWHWSEPTDEGYSFAAVTWIHHGDHITMERASGGRDCDGEVVNYYDAKCLIDDLPIYCGGLGDECRYPEWRETGAEVYDQYAQAMGY